MPENKKINLDAFLQRNGVVDSGEHSTSTGAPQEIDAGQMTPTLDSPSNTTEAKTDTAPAISHDMSTKKTIIEPISIESTQKDSKSVAPEESSKRHSLSLDRLKTRGRSEEEISEDKKEAAEKLEIQKHLAEIETENAASTGAIEAEEKEVFGNYESKFSSESTAILKKLRMPRTRIGMLLSLCILSVMIIGGLMYSNPETHSIGNYKASIIDIYNTSKEANRNKGPTGETSNTINEEFNRKNVSEEIEIQEPETPINRGNLMEEKEEIKAKNLKNFLINNYK